MYCETSCKLSPIWIPIVYLRTSQNVTSTSMLIHLYQLRGDKPRGGKTLAKDIIELDLSNGFYIVGIGLAIAFLASTAGALLTCSIVGNSATGLNYKCRQLLHWIMGQYHSHTNVWAARSSSSLVESWGCNKRNKLYWFEMASYVECLQCNPLLTDKTIWHQIHSPILSHSPRRATRMADRWFYSRLLSVT